jgi:hypothetical protein
MSTLYSFILHPSSFILQPSSFILHPSTFILQPSTFILQPSTFILQPSSFNLQPSSFILQPSSFNLHPSSFNLSPSNRCPSPHVYKDTQKAQKFHRNIKKVEISFGNWCLWGNWRGKSKSVLSAECCCDKKDFWVVLTKPLPKI